MQQIRKKPHSNEFKFKVALEAIRGKKTIAALCQEFGVVSSKIAKMNSTTQTRYYISFCQLTPKKILKAIRSHWAIENNLHWVLDMSFGEDMSRIRKNNGPQIMAVIRHIALNLLQLTKDKMKRQSIKRLRKMAGWDHQILSNILHQNFS